MAVSDLDIDGYRMPAGTPIAVSLLSALRDPDVYAEPERFDIARTDHPRWHPIFGGGAHRCVGEALAKAEMEETLRHDRAPCTEHGLDRRFSEARTGRHPPSRCDASGVRSVM